MTEREPPVGPQDVGGRRGEHREREQARPGGRVVVGDRGHRHEQCHRRRGPAETGDQASCVGRQQTSRRDHQVDRGQRGEDHGRHRQRGLHTGQHEDDRQLGEDRGGVAPAPQRHGQRPPGRRAGEQRRSDGRPGADVDGRGEAGPPQCCRGEQGQDDSHRPDGLGARGQPAPQQGDGGHAGENGQQDEDGCPALRAQAAVGHGGEHRAGEREQQGPQAQQRVLHLPGAGLDGARRSRSVGGRRPGGRGRT